MKKLTILAAFLIPTFITACSDPVQEKKERCTQLQHQATDAGRGKGERKYSEVKAEWDKLECHRSDIING